MADHEPGKMDIETQKETYDAFWTWSIRVAIICVVLLVLVIFFFG
ncbi:MAG: aa3-type cytochrome c oxidase subunit IV [Pseudomonadota bacterium]